MVVVAFDLTNNTTRIIVITIARRKTTMTVAIIHFREHLKQIFMIIEM
jgi:hypothetical protein